MKKSFLMMAMFAMVFASCKKEPAPSVLESDPLGNEPVPVMLSASAPTASIEVKSAGAVKSWNNHKVKIYAVEAAGETDYTTAAFMIENQEVEVSTDGKIAPKDSQHANGPYYYDPSKVYSFYGYYYDDATLGNVIEDASGVVYPITITGSQDVMVAVANPQEDVDAVVNPDPKLDVKYAYSAFTARRGVVPNLVFEHVLTRLIFKVVATSESAKDVTINSLTLNDINNQFNLKVLGANQGIVSGTTTGSVDFVLTTSGQDNKLTGLNDDLALGELLVIPAASYNFTLDITSTAGGYVVPITKDILASEVKKDNAVLGLQTFKASEYYEITIKLVGPEDVEVTATLKEWTDGGDWELDTDEPPTAGVRPETGGSEGTEDNA